MLKIDDSNERARCLNKADVVFLYLPNDAVRKAVGIVKNQNTMQILRIEQILLGICIWK